MKKGLSFAEQLLVIIFCVLFVLIIGFWIWAVGAYGDSQTGLDKTVLIVGILLTAILLCLLLRLIFNDREFRKRHDAWVHLLIRTGGAYFYGVSVSDCLRAGVVKTLKNDGLGDFARTLGLTVLFTLRKDKHDALLYSRHIKGSDSCPEHFDSIVRFNYNGDCWQFNLDEPLTDCNALKRIAPNSRSGNLISCGYKGLYFWILPVEMRLRVARTGNPSTSYVAPDVKYAQTSTYKEFTELTKKHVDKEVSVWRQRMREADRHFDHVPRHAAY